MQLVYTYMEAMLDRIQKGCNSKCRKAHDQEAAETYVVLN